MESVEKEIASGRIRGRRQNGVSVFKGIPYAESTGGTHRFLPPRPRRPWTGVLDASRFGDAAPQQDAFARKPLVNWYYAFDSIGEDCLSLNVYSSAADSERLPVMVWLHGGGWFAGAGSCPGYDATTLAREGRVVVVTINHRINAFGHLQLDDRDERFESSGNVGVLDMIEALRWVRDNIASFGGDAGNVTIFGQSGGGSKVACLMALPLAKGLFHKAISQSCSGNLRNAGRAEAAEMADTVRSALDLPNLRGETLQGISMERLLAAATASWQPFRPVLDGTLFARHPFDPDAPPTSAGVPLLIGNVSHETRGRLFDHPENFDMEMDDAVARLAHFLDSDRAQARSMLDRYGSRSDNDSPAKKLAAVTSDYVYIRNTERQAALQAEVAPTYRYLFDWRTPVHNGLLGSVHSLELPFLFGTTAAAVEMVGEGQYIAPLTKMMIETWSAFARTGNPNNATIPHWEPYDGRKATMVLDLESHLEHNPGGELRASLDRFPWYEYSRPMNYHQPCA